MGPGGGGPSAAGGTGRGEGDRANDPAEDTSKPTEKSEATSPVGAGDTVAPTDLPQSELVLRKLEDLLREKKDTSDIEKATGMTREEMEQFVQKFRGAPKGQARDAREIEVKPGQSRTLDPNRKAPDFNPGGSFSKRSERGSGMVAQDDERGLAEGTRSVAPREIRSRWEAYRSGISRSTTARAPRPATPPPPANEGGNR